MSTVITSVFNVSNENIIMQIPGYNNDRPHVTVNAVSTVDFSTLLTQDELWAMQDQINKFVTQGIFSPVHTMSYPLQPVLSIQADSGAMLQGDVKLLSGTNIVLNQIGQNITINASIPSFDVLVNTFYVDGTNGNDSTGTGSINFPYRTIGKAATVIGSASSNSEFNDAAKRFYVVNVSPGVYVESPTFGTRPHILLDLQNATLQGNLTIQLAQAAINGSGYQQPKFVIQCSDLRSGYGGPGGGQIVISGIDGNIFYESLSAGNLITELNLIKGGITGNITQRFGIGGGAFTLQLFLDSCIVAGTISNSSDPTLAMTLFVDNVDTSGSFALGNITGNINLNILRNVRLDGIVTTSGGGERWFNTTFSSNSHNFTGSSSNIFADSNSIASFNTNVPTKGSITFTKADDSIGVQYTPAVSGNWVSPPTSTQNAIDRIADRLVNGGSGPL